MVVCVSVHVRGCRCIIPVVDLPFGLAHKRIDVRALLSTLGVLLRRPFTTTRDHGRGGKAILLGSAGPQGTAAACSKVVRKWPRIASVRLCAAGAKDADAHECIWEECGRTTCYSGGVECIALELHVKIRPTVRADRCRGNEGT